MVGETEPRLTNRLGIATVLCVTAMSLAGCATKVSPPSNPLLALVGASGKVSLGDTLDQAKLAFPAPKGATNVLPDIPTEEGLAWNSRESGTAFYAVAEKGQVIVLALQSPKQLGEPSMTIRQLGPPTRRAEGNVASIAVWDVEPSARILLRTRIAISPFPAGTLTMIGSKANLKFWGFDADHPQALVTELDKNADVSFDQARGQLGELLDKVTKHLSH